ncbi:MAG: hypothetical protein ABWZ25_11940 [Chitinophagaceae bacterium]
MEKTRLIPDELRGKNTELSSEKVCKTEEQAVELYHEAVSRLLHPDLWGEIAGALSADFRLFKMEGPGINKNDPGNIPAGAGTGTATKTGEADLLKRLAGKNRAEEGDRIRISIPGPGSKSGDGYDWVEILLIESKQADDKEEEYTGMKVQPTDNPESDDDTPAHFLEPGSTSTFLIHRMGTTVTAAYYGRNEKINTHTSSVVDKIRNALVALGAFIGFSEVQWKALVKGLLNPVNEKD